MTHASRILEQLKAGADDPAVDGELRDELQERIDELEDELDDPEGST